MIDGLGSIGMNTYLEEAGAASSKAIDSSLDRDYSKAADSELMSACKEFEAYFLEQVFKALEKTATVTGEKDEALTSGTVDLFKDRMYQEYAKQTADSGNFGIAQALYEQMKRNYEL